MFAGRGCAPVAEVKTVPRAAICRTVRYGTCAHTGGGSALATFEEFVAVLEAIHSTHRERPKLRGHLALISPKGDTASVVSSLPTQHRPSTQFISQVLHSYETQINCFIITKFRELKLCAQRSASLSLAEVWGALPRRPHCSSLCSTSQPRRTCPVSPIRRGSSIPPHANRHERSCYGSRVGRVALVTGRA